MVGFKRPIGNLMHLPMKDHLNLLIEPAHDLLPHTTRHVVRLNLPLGVGHHPLRPTEELLRLLHLLWGECPHLLPLSPRASQMVVANRPDPMGVGMQEPTFCHPSEISKDQN